MAKVFQQYSFDYVFHYAAVVGVERTLNDPIAVLNDIDGIKIILELSLENNIKRALYNDMLGDVIETPVYSDTVQYYCARVPPEHRDSLIDYLADKKVHTSVHFKPLHKYSIVKQDREYPVADTEWLKLISLPVHPAMSDHDVEYVAYWVKKYFSDNVK